MTENKVAKQYWPDHLEVVASFPTTPAGKVQKFQRERARAFADTVSRAAR